MLKGRRPVLTASRKAACKPLPDNEIVPKTNIKSNICQLLHHGILSNLHLFDAQIPSAPLASSWQEIDFRGWFCVENRQNILRQDSRLLPTPPPFPPPPLPVRPAEQSPNVTAASWDYTARIGQSESMLWSHDQRPTNGSAAGRVR